MHQVTLIPGDGIGPEVTAAARDVVEASGVKIQWDVQPAGMKVGEETGNPLPERVFASIERTRIALKGPTGTPFGEAYRVERTVKGETRIYPSVAIALRKELKLFANVRPSKSYPGVASRFSGVDIVLFRENSEDLYLGLERMVDADTAEALKIITRGATQRMAKFSADYMRRTGRKRVTIGHKSNVLKLTDGLFLKAAQRSARRLSGHHDRQPGDRRAVHGTGAQARELRLPAAAESVRRHRVRPAGRYRRRTGRGAGRQSRH